MESYKVQMTAKAIKDLRDSYVYIARELKEPAVAEKWQSAMKESIGSLVHMPERYNIVDDERLADQGYRKFQVQNFIVFYFVDKENKIVTIARILYARRDWLNIL